VGEGERERETEEKEIKWFTFEQLKFTLVFTVYDINARCAYFHEMEV
jgi:hypothetical protein